jgi:hypothetical protein
MIRNPLLGWLLLPLAPSAIPMRVSCWLGPTHYAVWPHAELNRAAGGGLSQPTRLRTVEELPEAAQVIRRQPHEPFNPHACTQII